MWCSVVIDEGTKNKSVFYSRYIRPQLITCMRNVLARQEKYPLCILVDSQHLDMSIGRDILNDLIAGAGEHTIIDIIDLNTQPDPDSLFEEDDYIRAHQIPIDIPQLSEGIQMSFEHEEGDDDIQIPSLNGFVRLDCKISCDIESDMQIIHRKLANHSCDDQGEAFYCGGEASWHDIAYHRDVDRRDYVSFWHDRIKSRIEHLHSAGTVLMWLYHRPGGGGTTLAKRIMWDFCFLYPTVYLQKISDRTSERLKTLYKYSSNMPLLIVTGINDSQISRIDLSTLRTDLIKKMSGPCSSVFREKMNGPKRVTRSIFICQTRRRCICLRHAKRPATCSTAFLHVSTKSRTPSA